MGLWRERSAERCRVWERGMKLPNGDRAEISMAKLVGYCLNPDRPKGKNKARVFQTKCRTDKAVPAYQKGDRVTLAVKQL